MLINKSYTMTIQEAEAHRLSHLREFTTGDLTFPGSAILLEHIFEMDDINLRFASRQDSVELEEAFHELRTSDE